MILKCLIKNLLVVLLKTKLCQTNNYQMNYTNQLLENIRNIQHIFSFTDNMSHVNLADIQPISKYMRGIQFLLCTIDIYSKYA